jgi:hypothetical protein
MKYIYISLLFLLSCTKQVQPIKPTTQPPVLIQIEAVYIDGNVELSPIVVAR